MHKSTVMAPAHAIRVLSSGGLSDEGFAKKKNEDAWEIFQLESGEGTITVGVVADGVTSKAGGATASGLATETIRSVMQTAASSIYDPSALQACIDDAIHQANRTILEEARKHPEIGNMSTTLVLAAVGWGQLQLAYLGDSRAYLLRDKQLHRLTLDHTWAQEALDKGLINADELKNHPNRNVIRRFLGINRQIEIDRQILKPGHYQRNYMERDYTRSLALNQGDILLLCSDGLTERTSDVEIGSILSRRADQPQRAVGDLVQLALSRKEQDNITAAVLSLAQERRNVAGFKTIAWAAILAALLIVGFVGYGLFRQPQPATVESSSSEPDGQGVAAADVSIDGVQNNTVTVDSEEPLLVRSSATAVPNRAVASAMLADTVPASETRAAQNKAEKERTATAASVTSTVMSMSIPTATATESPQTTIDTSTPVRVVGLTEESFAIDTSEPVAATPAPPPTDDSEQVGREPNEGSTSAAVSIVGRNPASDDNSAADDQANTDPATNDPATNDPATNDPTTNDQSQTTNSQENVSSTPTRKILPTAEPTKTPTPTQLATFTPIPGSAGASRAASATQSASAAEAKARNDSLSPLGVTASSARPNTSDGPAQGDEGASAVESQFTFVLPPDRETIQAGTPVAFQWITDYQLSANQVFEVVVWQPREGQSVAIDHGMGMVDIKHSPPEQLDATTWRLQTAPPRGFDAGEYAWAVLVVEIEPSYRRIAQIGNETRKFTLAKEGGSSSSGSSSKCKGSACGDR